MLNLNSNKCSETGACVSCLTSISHIPHGVFEGPDDGVQHQFELGRGDGEECREAVRVYSLE